MVAKRLGRWIWSVLATVAGLLPVACGAVPPASPPPVPAVVWAASNVPAGHDPTGVAVGDWNGDGKPDLATLNEVDNTVSVLLNQGSALFSAPQVYATGLFPESIVTGDFDGDGRSDLAVLGWPSLIGILLNRGDGSFAPIARYSIGGYYQTMVSLDVNRDGLADLVLASPYQETLLTLLNQGRGVFSSAAPFYTGVTPFAMAVGDLNQDGAADLVVGTDSGFSVWLNRGGTLVPTTTYGSSGPFGVSLAVADIDGDSQPDVVAGASYGESAVDVWRNDGHGTLRWVGSIDNRSGAYVLGAGDIDGDGRIDILIGGDELTLALNQPDHTFVTISYDIGGGRSMAIADLNADGRLDLAFADGWKAIRLLLNQPPWAQ